MPMGQRAPEENLARVAAAQGLEVYIELEGSLTEQQVDRLQRAAGRCPVKRMLLGELRDGVRTTCVQRHNEPPP